MRSNNNLNRIHRHNFRNFAQSRVTTYNQSFICNSIGKDFSKFPRYLHIKSFSESELRLAFGLSVFHASQIKVHASSLDSPISLVKYRYNDSSFMHNDSAYVLRFSTLFFNNARDIVYHVGTNIVKRIAIFGIDFVAIAHLFDILPIMLMVNIGCL